MFTLRKHLVAEITRLQAALNDREEHIAELIRLHQEERKDLLDRLMSIAHPVSLRAKAEAERPVNVLANAIPHRAEAPRPNIPGLEPNLRPAANHQAVLRSLRRPGPGPRPIRTSSDIEEAAGAERLGETQ